MCHGFRKIVKLKSKAMFKAVRHTCTKSLNVKAAEVSTLLSDHPAWNAIALIVYVPAENAGRAKRIGARYRRPLVLVGVDPSMLYLIDAPAVEVLI